MFLNDLNLLERKSPIYPWEIIDAEGDIRICKCMKVSKTKNFQETRTEETNQQNLTL